MAILKKIQRFFIRNKEDPQSVSKVQKEPSPAAKVGELDNDQWDQTFKKADKKMKIASVVLAASIVCLMVLGITLAVTVNINCVHMLYLIPLMPFGFFEYCDSILKKL